MDALDINPKQRKNRLERNSFEIYLPEGWKMESLSTKTNLYDWATDTDALVYNPPEQKYLCPDGHECYRANKKIMQDYIWCNKCLSFNIVNGNRDYSIGTKGMYYAISSSRVKTI